MYRMIDTSLTKRLWERLTALRRSLLDGMSTGLPALAALDLTVPQSMVIFRLVEVGPATISELCATSGRSQAATSHLVAGLERKKLVVRKADPEDARRTVVHATATARNVVAEVEALRLRALEKALRGVPAGTVRRFDEALAALLAALEK
jgi:DNA-binding MarR family transcriptional regulator